jgi:hypothetical protein
LPLPQVVKTLDDRSAQEIGMDGDLAQEGLFALAQGQRGLAAQAEYLSHTYT